MEYELALVDLRMQSSQMVFESQQPNSVSIEPAVGFPMEPCRSIHFEFQVSSSYINYNLRSTESGCFPDEIKGSLTLKNAEES